MKKEMLFVLLLILGTAMSFAQEVDATVADTAAIDTTPPEEEVVIHTADVCFDLDKGRIVVNETVSPTYHETYDRYEHYAARQLHLYTIQNGQKELLFENFCTADFIQKGKKIDVYLWPTALTETGDYESKQDFSEGAEAIIHFAVGRKSLKCSLDEVEGISLPDQLAAVGNQRKEALETYRSVKSFAPWIETMFKSIEQTYNFCIGLRGKDLSLDETRAMCAKYITNVQKPYDKIAETEPTDEDVANYKLWSKIEGITPLTQLLTGKIGGDDTPYTIVAKSYYKMVDDSEDVSAETGTSELVKTLVMVMLEISSPSLKEPLRFVDSSILAFTNNNELPQPFYRILEDGTIEGKMVVDKDDIAGEYMEVLAFDAKEQALSILSEYMKGTEKDKREMTYTIKYLKPEPLTKIEQ
jgi:hypothetical protein